MAFVVELIISALLVIGAFFLLVGSLGLAKLPDTMRRLHGPTKATTLGIGSLLIASMLYFFTQHGQLSIHELLITLFLFLTAPISANMIAKAHILRSAREREAITPAGADTGWATLQPPGPAKGH
ncbi:Na+/H+ antiporter subunit G [Ancylobacter rudongensis]|uniref:Multisubunit potassium/proton antiporter, PhaG subunit (TC 2.A.63.1.1) n=1 Tax=Ancylobacter rudongensis TaxID=177413 RepID=A0A1G4PBU2_9HYPH|nr:Na+/H+ antiporter subunit G [Ancylobacter rudongensis]SCW29736.1 multisubunit potassium/proton antiporter, PhaG subunit (TC 2.A.63.1.1) [Ancylobacter rudongensis]